MSPGEAAYKTLGVLPSCTDQDLKAAWRSMAMRWHPDQNDEAVADKANDMSRAINGAYEVAVALRARDGSRDASGSSSSRSSSSGRQRSGWWEHRAGQQAEADWEQWWRASDRERRGADFAHEWREKVRDQRRTSNYVDKATTLVRDFRDAANMGDDDTVESMMQSGQIAADSPLHSSGSRALHFAAKEGHLSTVEVLLRGGASPRVTDDSGRNSIFGAVRLAHGGMVRYTRTFALHFLCLASCSHYLLYLTLYSFILVARALTVARVPSHKPYGCVWI